MVIRIISLLMHNKNVLIINLEIFEETMIAAIAENVISRMKLVPLKMLIFCNHYSHCRNVGSEINFFRTIFRVYFADGMDCPAYMRELPLNILL